MIINAICEMLSDFFCDKVSGPSHFMVSLIVRYCHYKKAKSLSAHNPVVNSSNKLNIATFVHQMWDVCVWHLVNKIGNMYLIWTKNNQYPIYWFAYKYSRTVILATVLYLYPDSSQMKINCHFKLASLITGALP